MNIQTITPKLNQNNRQNNNINSNKKNPQFTGAFDAVTMGLRFLDTNQAWGANAVDLASMVVPRTVVDMANRGPEAGMETARRESSGTINHSLVGVYGSIAGLFFASALNNMYGVKANKLFIDDETISLLGKSWDKQVKAGNNNKEARLNNYLKDVFTNLETRVGDDWVKIQNSEEIDDIVNKFSKELLSDKAPHTISKDLKAYTQSVISHSTGSESNFRLVKDHKTSTISNLLDSIYGITRTFVNGNEKIEGAFAKDFAENPYLKSLKNLNRNRALLGLGIASAVGMSVQPLNIYLTKKKTGSDGFVGVEGREKDNSTGFKVMKTAAALLFSGGIFANIGLEGGVKGLMKKIQFKGLVPSIDQLKFVYGATILSRFLAARDKDELRESVVKDVLGFFNWLVLGNFVAKMTANSLDQNLLNYSEKEHGKGFFNKLIKSPLVTRDEVIHRALKAAGLSSIENGKPLSFKEMLKKLGDTKVSEALRKETKGKLRALSIAQVAGYLYSGIVLGVGIPKLNIYMTNKSEAKRKARIAAEKQNQNPSINQQYNAMLKPDNLAFLSKNM